jgi:hypothetical protein
MAVAKFFHYLWVAGEYWWWKDHPKYPISSYLRKRFENLKQDVSAEPLLATVLGTAV